MARSILKTTGAKIFQLVKDFYLGISNSYVAKAKHVNYRSRKILCVIRKASVIRQL